jgi:hypothetical protein
MEPALLIPIIAIAGSFAIPIVAIVMDFRKRRLMFEERRAMIERGMDLPPLQDSGFDTHKWQRDPVARRERSLQAGVTMVFLGIGLGLAAWLLQNVVDQTFIPKRLTGPLTVGAAIVSFLGFGNLVYYYVTARRGNPPAA